jgi:hypothetical protein
LPPERVFVPGPAAGRFSDDYYAHISQLDHEALGDTALPGLLSLPLATTAAVRLFRVERQAEPLPGPEALNLYPELARLGERRFNLLRRVPRDDALALLKQPDLPSELRLDLLQLAFDAAQGLLLLYAPFHLVQPRAARAGERVRALLRAALAKSPEAALAVGTPDDQAELYRDLLEARRPPPHAAGGPAPPAAPVLLATGHSLLEACSCACAHRPWRVPSRRWRLTTRRCSPRPWVCSTAPPISTV